MDRRKWLLKIGLTGTGMLPMNYPEAVERFGYLRAAYPGRPARVGQPMSV